MPVILITGANGQVGRELRTLAATYAAPTFIFTDREELDITRPADIQRKLEEHQPDVLINCAAYTAVDKAESEPEEAAMINAGAPAFLAKACAEAGTFLIHLSTDYVYDNQRNRPLLETDDVYPQSVYARTKLEGEYAIWERTERAMVLRTSWVYSPFGHNFVKTMLRLGKKRHPLRIVVDQIGTPTYGWDLAQAILEIIINHPYADHPGTYNYSNEGVASWYDFAMAIFTERNMLCPVDPILSEAYPTPAHRPVYSVLDKTKIKETFDLEIPHWMDSLHHCLSRM